MEKWSQKNETELIDVDEEEKKESTNFKFNQADLNLSQFNEFPSLLAVCHSDGLKQRCMQQFELYRDQDKISQVESYTNHPVCDFKRQNQLYEYCWCGFDYRDYGLSKLQANSLLNNLVEAAVGPKVRKDSDLNKNTIYLKLLQSYDYEYTTEVNPVTGNFQAIYCWRFRGCDKKFSRAWNLLHHARIHRGEKPYSCQICLKQFAQKGNLKKHISVHLFSKRSQRN